MKTLTIYAVAAAVAVGGLVYQTPVAQELIIPLTTDQIALNIPSEGIGGLTVENSAPVYKVTTQHLQPAYNTLGQTDSTQDLQ